MAEVTLVSAIAKLEGDTQQSRADGLTELKRILDPSSYYARADSIPDDAFHKTFELLYKIISKQKPVYIRATTKPTTRNNAASRLQVTASALRLAVEVGASRIRFKTALSILDHIVETLPNSDGSYCEPLLNDYLKIFKTLLEYTPHCEHMRPKQWQKYVDFVLNMLSAGIDDLVQTSDVLTSRDSRNTSRNGHSWSMRLSQRTVRTKSKDGVSAHSDELIATLKSLTAVASAPIMSRGDAIAKTMEDYLLAGSRGQEAAFEILNNVIFIALTTDVDFTRTLISSLIPVIRRFWSHHSVLLREQMLITLFSCRYLFISRSSTWPPKQSNILEPILETMLSEYNSRSERDILLFDDMQLWIAEESAPLHTEHFLPARNSPRALNAWASLSVIACLILGRKETRRHDNDFDSEADEGPRKRQKFRDPTEDIWRLATEGVGQSRLVALQILVFLCDQPAREEVSLPKDLAELLPGLSNEDTNIQSWTYVLFSRLALKISPNVEFPPENWLLVWHSARQAISVPSTARAASHTLAVLLESGHLRTKLSSGLISSTIFGGSSSGPSALTDTSLLLMTNALRSDFFDNGGAFEPLCLKVINWVSTRWTLPAVLDRSHNASISFHVRAELLYSLLTSICGFSQAIKPIDDWSPAHVIWRAAMITSPDDGFLRYLLEIAPDESPEPNMVASHNLRQFDSPLLARLQNATLTFLSNRLKEFESAFITLQSERKSNIGADVIGILAVATAVCASISVRLSPAPSTLSSTSWNTVWSFVNDFVSSETGDMCILTNRICSSVLRVHAQLCGTKADWACEEYHTLVETALQLARNGMHSTSSKDDTQLDLMDEDAWTSQSTQRGTANTTFSQLRQAIPLNCDEFGQLASNRINLAIALQVVKTHGTLVPSAVSLIVDEIVELEPGPLLAARGAVSDLLALDYGMTRSDAARLLQLLGKTYLQEESYERCETALCFCLRVVQGLGHLWISEDEGDSLEELAFDIYNYSLNIAMGKFPPSTRVLSQFSELLHLLLQQNPSYGTEDLPSPRTSLLKILQISPPATKYCLSEKLFQLFEKFILTQHEAIFDDIVENLPSDPDDKEGIAARLFILGQLGARWHTVLRQATYHLFETAANVPSSTALSRSCISFTSKKLQLDSATELFKLFVPQISYTWLSKDSFSRMPFQAFGYATLKEMVLDNLQEFVGQTALRGANYADELAEIAGGKWTSLLADAFPTALAYTLSSETSLPKQERLYDGSEKLMRKQLGSETYLELLQKRMPDIVAQLIVSLQNDRAIEKAFEKSQHTSALNAWEEMSTQSTTNLELPLSQQPSFRARCLGEELNYICSRLNVVQSDIWSPALTVHVYRSLLSKARPALGPLHACSIIRKIRIAISLSGPTALCGYPLEMLLHNLRPYLTVFECAEDTMGIFRYLLQHGKPYLNSRISFLAGLGVSIFASLTGFITSSQESTTQESHFRATISKAQEFRLFLSHLLEGLTFVNVSQVTLGTFRRILEHAKSIEKPGSNARSTSEGCLLLALLDDRSSESPLLTPLHFDISLEILCKNFTTSSDPADDILLDDLAAQRSSIVLTNAIKTVKTNEEFRIWAASAIGRGYLMHGMTNDCLESPHKDFRLTNATNPKLEKDKNRQDMLQQDMVSSYTNIIEVLIDLLWRSDLVAAAFAEKTLQSIASNIAENHEGEILAKHFDRSIFADLRFESFGCPPIGRSKHQDFSISLQHANGGQSPYSNHWAADLLRELCSETMDDPVLRHILPLIAEVPSVADTLFPYAVHIILAGESSMRQNSRDRLSQAFSSILQNTGVEAAGARPLVLRTILYLRTRFFVNETTMAQRNIWLDIDFSQAVVAATECHMFHEALLFLEIHNSQSRLQGGRSSRKSLGSLLSSVSHEVETSIYENVDDLDFFYGKHEDSDLHSVLAKLAHEGASQKALSFQSALLDSHLKIQQSGNIPKTVGATAMALKSANMYGISEAVKRYYEDPEQQSQLSEAANPFAALTQWDVMSSDGPSGRSDTTEALLKSMNHASSKQGLESMIDRSLLNSITHSTSIAAGRAQTNILLLRLAILAEARQVLSAHTQHELDSIWKRIVARDKQIQLAEFEKLSPILSAREATFAALRRNPNLQAAFGLTFQQSLLQEIHVVRQSLHSVSDHSIPQFSLNRAMYLSELNHLGLEVGLNVEVAIQYDLATTLWAQDETSGSIGILQSLVSRKDANQQILGVTMAQILTDLGHKVAEARLEQPDEIIKSYLQPAFDELRGKNYGIEAGRVFHNFAAFCDMQLQDTDNLDDFTRISKIRDRKLRELNDLKKMIETSEGKQRDQLKGHLNKTKVWYNLDDKEFKRVSENRESLILQCLENYLLSMKACDEYRNDTLRFLALWLNQADSSTANASVSKYLSAVPTLKFAPLVNQLSSRLLDGKDKFQILLMDLMFRICSDHPYHSLYQVFSTSKTKAPKTDEVASSRNSAANKLAESVAKKSPSAAIWIAIHNSSIALYRVAQERIPDKDAKQGTKIPLRKLPSALKLEQMMTEAHTKIPPPTMNIALRADRDYSGLPTFSKFDQQIAIAGGVSAPKIATMIASDGSAYKMLLKGGNDDLRQDAIMEQVFGQVSELLKDHRPTRQRNLGIRTYRVIPLTTNAGIIEFVKDTIPLGDYLSPAHERYFPKDFKFTRARREIADAQTKPMPQRLQAYKTVTNNFHPVMRFFFMENFLDPDEWFHKRLNYSRSTAAVSILGHVLGLGDRHGHNILLDHNSGEVVHIDLGVAFEAGRVLPVPEVVPFRLTRDLVDGMGLTGVEGVFRRCCNFTLEALRRDQEAIMTILDVLRYDPLYSWSISPLRLQRIQEHNEQVADAMATSMSTTAGAGMALDGNGVGGVVGAARRDISEPSEADRALTVVAKKLGKSLSVEATVNELIRQATDERNLAVLYCGWAAFA